MALSRETLESFKAELRERYIGHEITADEYASLAEDIAVMERRTHGTSYSR